MKNTLRLTLIALAFTTLYGCGGDGGSGPAPITDSYVFPAGKTTLTFTAISTARLSAPVSGIDFSLALPTGMSLTTAGGTSGQIDSTTVTPGSALTGTNLAFGTYSVSTRKARLSMATTSDSYRSGEFLRLSCTVAPGASITLADLKALNAPVTVTRTVGYDAATQSTVILTGKVSATIGIMR